VDSAGPGVERPLVPGAAGGRSPPPRDADPSRDTCGRFSSRPTSVSSELRLEMELPAPMAGDGCAEQRRVMGWRGLVLWTWGLARVGRLGLLRTTHVGHPHTLPRRHCLLAITYSYSTEDKRTARWSMTHQLIVDGAIRYLGATLLGAA
jgi:hypothetical protein